MLAALRGTLRAEVSPITIRSRILKDHGGGLVLNPQESFTHHDPFEDTESTSGPAPSCYKLLFHPSRSVRGY